MKDILVFVPQYFEDTELTAVVDVIGRSGLTYDLVSVNNKEKEEALTFVQIATTPIQQMTNWDYRALFLPGGNIGDQYLANAKVVEVIKTFAQQEKWLTAICAGPNTYFKLGLLKDVKYAAFPNFAVGPNKIDQPVVVDRNFITARDYKASIQLGEVMVDKIKNQQT